LTAVADVVLDMSMDGSSVLHLRYRVRSAG
jgi:hypothetical protein